MSTVAPDSYAKGKAKAKKNALLEKEVIPGESKILKVTTNEVPCEGVPLIIVFAHSLAKSFPLTLTCRMNSSRETWW